MIHLFNKLRQPLPGIILNALLFSLLFATTITAVAQSGTAATDGATPTGMQPGAPAGSYPLSGFDNVNLFNGHMNFSLPLIHMGGRGSAGYTVNLNLERQWRARKTALGSLGILAGNGRLGRSPGGLLAWCIDWAGRRSADQRLVQ